MDFKKTYTFDKVIRIAITIAIIWGVVKALNYLSAVLMPFAVAILLAYLINPLVNFMQKKLKHRVLAVLSSLVIVVLVIGVIAGFIIPKITQEIKYTGQILTQLVTNKDLEQQAANTLPANIWNHAQNFIKKDEVQNFLTTENFVKLVGNLGHKIFPGVWGLITGTASFVMGILGIALIALYLIFILLDYHKLKNGWKELIPPAYRKSTTEFVETFNDGMNRYFRGQALVAASVGVLFAVGFSIIGLPMGIFLGLFVGLLNMVPYLQIIGFIPAVILDFIYAIETGSSLLRIIGLTALVFIVVQTIQDVIIVPRIMKKVTGLSPSIILLSLCVWGKLLGIFGLIIALPMTCLLWAYYTKLINR